MFAEWGTASRLSETGQGMINGNSGFTNLEVGGLPRIGGITNTIGYPGANLGGRQKPYRMGIRNGHLPREEVFEYVVGDAAHSEKLFAGSPNFSEKREPS